MPENVSSSIWFLKRDSIYETEKVYELKYDPPNGLPKNNMRIEKRGPVTIEDIRGRESGFSFSQNGFTIMNMDCDMLHDEFEDDEKVLKRYLPEVAHQTKQHLGAARVQVVDFIIRKRHAEFPICTEDFYQYNQPSALAHIDTTPLSTEELFQGLAKNDASHASTVRYQYVNVWKPLVGPIRDWPLTVCDHRTVDARKDLQARDLVDRNIALETFQVHYSPAQKWYYLSSQTPNEAWVFLQSDSSPNGLVGLPHTSFLNPNASTSDTPRESIEVRTLVSYIS